MRSYAQNGEDLNIWNILNAKQSGFYIDIGCSDWQAGSVSYFFYERGWMGLCVDVQQQYQAGFTAHRPRDTFLCAGVSDRSEERCLYDSFGQLSTFAPEHLDALIQKGVFPKGFGFDQKMLQTTTLRHILDANPPVEIDFMKIDVEGFEYKALQGNDWLRYRPRLIILEATEPCNLSVRTDLSCTQFLTKKNYKHILFDGLNSYYIDKESQ